MDDPILTTLVARRRELGLSKHAVYTAIGMSRGSHWQREHDLRWRPIEQLEKWAGALGYRLVLIEKQEEEPTYWS